MLTALSLFASTLVTVLKANDPPELKYAIKLTDGLQQALGHVRKLSRGLVPIEVDSEGLTSALFELVGQFDELEEVSAIFECPCPVHITDNQVATHLYRIAQEGVTNALKHGKPTRIRITLEDKGKELTLTIEDNGIGFQPSQARRTSGGLRTMRYRSELIGATFDVHSCEMGGTQVTCTLFHD